MEALHSLAAKAYSAFPTNPPTHDAASFFASRAEEFAATLARADTAAQDAVQGKGDSHTLVTALAQSELAVETVVTLRNKVVEAYQEIMRMAV